jgi:predicted PurR-regulated permease PerM
MRRYFRGQALIALSVGVLFVIGFSIIGLRMAVVLGLFIGMLNMIPYLQTVGLVPALLLAIVRAIERDGSLLVSAVLVLAVFAIVQTIQDTLLTPKIMGKTTGLKPVAILLGVFIWGKLLGFLGVLLAIPLTCLVSAYYRRFVLGGERLEPEVLADDPKTPPEADSN